MATTINCCIRNTLLNKNRTRTTMPRLMSLPFQPRKALLFSLYSWVLDAGIGIHSFSPLAFSTTSRNLQNQQQQRGWASFSSSSTTTSTSSSSSITSLSMTTTTTTTTDTNGAAAAAASTGAGSGGGGKLSPRILETLDPCVVLMKDMIGQYAELWEDKGGIFSLAQGVVYWEPPTSCQEALLEEFSKPNNLLHTYGPAQGIPELQTALLEKVSKENGMNNHSVMVTVGANQAYVNVVLTLLCDTSKAIVFSPYYFNHVMALQMCCGKESVVVGPTNDDGIPDIAWLENTLSTQSIDMVTIVNPGNPTGVSLSKDLLQQVVDLCEKYSTWLILDCTYEYFTTSEEDQPLATFPNASHVIHIFSLSKSYSLAGYRCGYLCISKSSPSQNDNGNDNDDVLSNMLKVQDTLPIGPPRVSQIAALGALKAGNDWVREKYATLDSSREIILDALQSLPKIMGGTGAMYVMAQLPTTSKNDANGDANGDNDIIVDDIEVCRRLVKEFGIAIIPGTFCGAPGWIRVCYANLPPDRCILAAERLKKGLQSIF